MSELSLAKERSLRKQFQDLIDALPIEMQKVGRKYEVYSVGTKKQWIQWLVQYNQILNGFDETFTKSFEDLVSKAKTTEEIIEIGKIQFARLKNQSVPFPRLTNRWVCLDDVLKWLGPDQK
jgi:hypothetical protein